jgi:hypothetical protein
MFSLMNIFLLVDLTPGLMSLEQIEQQLLSYLNLDLDLYLMDLLAVVYHLKSPTM